MNHTHTHIIITKPKVYILFHKQRTKMRLTGQSDNNDKDIYIDTKVRPNTNQH